jgi:hypothetical protein
MVLVEKAGRGVSDKGRSMLKMKVDWHGMGGWAWAERARAIEWARPGGAQLRRAAGSDSGAGAGGREGGWEGVGQPQAQQRGTIHSRGRGIAAQKTKTKVDACLQTVLALSFNQPKGRPTTKRLPMRGTQSFRSYLDD